MLHGLLRAHSERIHDRWLDAVLDEYPAEAKVAWSREQDRFANPVGHALRTGTRALLDVLLERRPTASPGEPGSPDDADPLDAALDDIVRIRAVQSFEPSEAVGFVFLLKGVVRDVLDHDLDAPLGAPGFTRDLAAFDACVDRAGLRAFDLYVAHRERVSELRIDELKRTIPWASGRVAARAEEETP